jgi:hypothetical protein
MTPDNDPPPLSSQSAVVGYTIFCLTALMGLALALMENDHEMLLILLLTAVGVLGVVARWRAAPSVLLLGLAVLELYHRAAWQAYSGAVDWRGAAFIDAVLCAAVLAYSAGLYRLLSLAHTILPIDSRPPPSATARQGRRRPKPFGLRQRRSPGLPKPWEMALLAMTAVGWAAAVSGFWVILSAVPPPLSMSRELWRGLLLIFTVGLATAILAGAVAYLGWITATPEEHLLFLQDQTWRETRREQNQINRWLTWARLRAQRRKEKT